jgi:hypothetical protein
MDVLYVGLVMIGGSFAEGAAGSAPCPARGLVDELAPPG